MEANLVYAVAENVIVDGDISRASFFGDYREHLAAQGRSANTISAYLSDVKQFAEWFVKTNQMAFFPSCITNHDLRAYRRACRDVERVSASTLNRRLASLQSFAVWAQDVGHLDDEIDLFRGVQRGRRVEAGPNWLNDQEYHRLMRCAEQGANTGIWVGSKQVTPSEYGREMAIRDLALLSLMVLCGLRVAEVAALRWDDITLGERSGMVKVFAGKGDKDREVPMNAEARGWLRMWMEVCGGAEAGVAVFSGRNGDALGVRGMQERVSAIAGAAGVEAVTPHRLRHTFGRRFMLANRETLGDDALMILARLMGHERLETTLRYAQPGRAEMAAAIENM